MDSNNRKFNNSCLSGISLLLIILVVTGCKAKEEKVSESYPWQNYRGANVGHTLSEQDIIDFKATGGNLIRLSFPVIPFADLEPPYALQESAFDFLEQVLDICEREDVAVLIDPHRFPGTMHQWTMLNTDPFWQEKIYQDKAVEIWEEIARRTATRGKVVAGLDLLNEPALEGGFEKGSLKDLNLLYQRLIDAIRPIDSVHAIMLAAPRYLKSDTELSGDNHGYVEGLRVLEMPTDDNLVVTIHMYKPQGFTHQGIWEDQDTISPYPGTYYEGVYWDKNTIDEYILTAYNWSKQNGDVPIFVGEFSCPRTLGEMGNTYIRDCIDVFEKYGFSWAYHAWRENQIFDAEMSIYERADSVRSSENERIVLLKSYFQRN